MEEKVKPSIEWMEKNYDILNKQLFGGQLPNCNFDIFTTGEGANGKTLGYFQITGRLLYYPRERHYFIKNGSGETIYLNRHNFYDFAKPYIKLNGNYMWSERSMTLVLVHEMVHLATYMNGNIPKQAHGHEFRALAEQIAVKSNGLFTVQRLANAETMNGMELDAEIKAKNDAKLARKKSKLIAICVLNSDRKGELSLTTSQDVVDLIISNAKSRIGKSTPTRQNPIKMTISNDANLIDKLMSMGYKKAMRTHRFWTLNGNILQSLFDEAENNVIFDLTNENRKMNLDKIISESIAKYLNEDEAVSSEEPIETDPNMNLSIISPLENY